jgi:hypothetical protein
MKQIVCRPPKPTKPGVCGREPYKNLATYNDVVNDYIRCYRDYVEGERKFFRKCSFRKAIRHAGLCMRSDGKRHPHHQRRSEATLIHVESILQECANRMRAYKTFDELHELVHSEIHPIDDVGPLLVYDVATNIGTHLGLSPDRIYLHRGTRDGAKALLSIKGRKTINRSELPPAFMRLRRSEIEDCLCIYERELARIARRNRQGN